MRVVFGLSDGSFEYEPPDGFIGTDSFTYQAFDGTSSSWMARGSPGGQPGFSVFRSSDPSNVLDPGNELGQTSGRSWDDLPPVGDVFYYRVISP
ncbi:MAG: hypothetical protein GY722_10820 [bacterium]|nr:hypothetical protein [bacterium]